ncbi:MAG: magnesium/cobalt transporter CorA [Bacteroidota bacterium]|nr:magnesium/cobalt transporter CorA [Bacteroidota bacterium]MDX5430078.1 magnesium/cobalt transporter CorA [Bacteroidota bacterium]MDX5468842.1 magnesium/cobalt transporter CorA [Bacteroidota bacterium]
MKKKSRKRIKKVPVAKSLPGTAPGHYLFDTGVMPRLILHSYTSESLITEEYFSLESAKKEIDSKPEMKHWLQVIGYGNTEFFNQIKELFDVHALELEDIISGNSRPKMEVHRGKVFDISRILFYNADHDLMDEQFSLFYTENWLLSLQETELDCFNPIKDRLNLMGTLIRNSPSFYLYYAISDAIIDNYFPMMELIENRLESLEEEVFDRPKREHLNEIQQIRRDLLTMKKTISAERENLADLIRSMDSERQEKFGLYMQDAYEHCLHIQELIDSQKEIAFSLVDVYLSSQNNRMSETMKVLTVITSIFIPLSFIAGLYGMNFMSHDDAGNPLPYNMPELREPYGYLMVLGVMGIVVLVQLIFFRRKGWI